MFLGLKQLWIKFLFYGSVIIGLFRRFMSKFRRCRRFYTWLFFVAVFIKLFVSLQLSFVGKSSIINDLLKPFLNISIMHVFNFLNLKWYLIFDFLAKNRNLITCLRIPRASFIEAYDIFWHQFLHFAFFQKLKVFDQITSQIVFSYLYTLSVHHLKL